MKKSNTLTKSFIFILVFILNHLVCSAQEWLESSHTERDGAFSIDMSGNYVIIGVWSEDSEDDDQNTISQAGAAYIYERSASGQWTLMQRIEAMDRAYQDKFGFDVGISDEGYAIIGNDGNADAAYLFEYDGTQWLEKQKIEGPEFSSFGHTVAINGNKALIGDHSDGISGAVFLYHRSSITGDWFEVTKIDAYEQSQGFSSNSSFGSAIDISSSYIIVGAPYLDLSQSELNFGAAYIYSSVDGSYITTLNFPLLQAGDKFGQTVAISDFAAIVGMPEHSLDIDGSDDQGAENDPLLHPGIVGVFSAQDWSLQKIVSPDRDPNDQFGVSVDIYEDVAIVGANQEGLDAENQDFTSFAGAAYILARGDNGWAVTDKISAANRSSQDKFGMMVSIGEKRAGILNEDDGIYFFDKCDGPVTFTIEAERTVVCEGDSVILSSSNVSDEVDFQWYANACGGLTGVSLGMGDSIKVAPTQTTSYFARARGIGACKQPSTCEKVTISTLPVPVLTAAITNEMIGNDGAIDLTVSSGTPPYQYDWNLDNSADFDDTEDQNGLTAGTYTITVKDKSGCMSTKKLEVLDNINALSSNELENKLEVYPIPAGETLHLNVEVNQVLIIDLIGNHINKSVVNGTVDIKNLPSGIYWLIVSHKKSIRFIKN